MRHLAGRKGGDVQVDMKAIVRQAVEHLPCLVVCLGIRPLVQRIEGITLGGEHRIFMVRPGRICRLSRRQQAGQKQGQISSRAIHMRRL